MLSAANCIWPIIILSPASDWHGWLGVWNVGGRAAFAGHHTVAGPFLEHSSPRPGKEKKQTWAIIPGESTGGWWGPLPPAPWGQEWGPGAPQQRCQLPKCSSHPWSQGLWGTSSPASHAPPFKSPLHWVRVSDSPAASQAFDCAVPPRKPLWKECGVDKGLLFLHKEKFHYSGEAHSLHYEFTPLGSLDLSGCWCPASAPLPWSGHSSSLRGRDPKSIQQWLSSRPWEGIRLGSTEGERVVPKSGEALEVKINYVWEEEVGPIPSPSGWKKKLVLNRQGMQGL